MNNKGFSVVELVVIVLIILTLIGVGVAALTTHGKEQGCEQYQDTRLSDIPGKCVQFYN